MKTVAYICLGLALVAAVVYILMGVGVLDAGDLGDVKAPPGITYIAAAGYIIGGLLIFLHKRPLLITGAIINALVIIMFFVLHRNNSTVLASAPGLITKIAQILLEAGLVYLILKYKKSTPAK